MEINNSQISSKYSGRINKAKLKPGITNVLYKYATILWVICIIGAIFLVIGGIKLAVELESFEAIFGTLLVTALALLFAYVIKILIEGVADLFYNINISAEMSVINTAFNIEKETGIDVYNGIGLGVTSSSNSNASYAPKSTEDWICKCGYKNSKGSSYCISCGSKKP